MPGLDYASLISAAGNMIAATRSPDKSWIPEAAWPYQLEMMRDPFLFPTMSARKHGIHPVYAAGAQTANVPSFTAMDEPDQRGDFLSRMGQDLASAVRPHMTKEQRELHQSMLGQNHARAVADYAMASYYSSLAARTLGADGSSRPMPAAIMSPDKASSSPLQGMIELTPHEQVTIDPSRPHVAAGINPAFQEFNAGSYGVIRLPSEKAKESMEDVPWMAYPFIIGENIRGGLSEFFERVWPRQYDSRGRSPAKRQAETIKRHAPRFSQW